MSCCHASPVITYYPYLTGGLFISVITLLLVVFSIKIFRFTNPAIKYRLMFLPLVAPVVAYLTYPPLVFKKYLFLSSPFFIVTRPMSLADDPVAAIIALLVWAGIAWAVLNGVMSVVAAWRLRHKHRVIGPADEPELFKILTGLLKKTKVRRVTVLYLPGNTPVAYTFGLLRPTLVVSKGLVEQLHYKELEAVVAHEIAHMVRRDSLSIWLAKILRDVMFYNPLSYLIYAFLAREKEKASDEWGITLTKKPVVFARSIYKVWKLVLNFNTTPARIGTAAPYLVPKTSLLEERVEMALNCSGEQYPKRHKYLSWVVIVLVGLVWFSLINIGVLAPAKSGSQVYLNKPIVAEGKYIAGKVYLHFPAGAQNEINFVSMCSDMACHSTMSGS